MKKKENTQVYVEYTKVFPKHYKLKFKRSEKSEKECKMPNIVNHRTISNITVTCILAREWITS